MEDTEILILFKEERSRQRGFELLMQKYQERLYWHIRRLLVSHEDAEDVLQETFVKVYGNLNKFKGESQLYTWLYRVATNECGQFFRRNKLQTSSYEERNLKLLEEQVTDSEEEILIKFQKAILLLPEKQRLVFNMRYYDDLTYEEIGQILNSKVGALKTNYHYATEKIKEYLIKGNV